MPTPRAPVLPRRLDDDPTIARAEIVNHIVWRDLSQPQHRSHDARRSPGKEDVRRSNWRRLGTCYETFGADARPGAGRAKPAPTRIRRAFAVSSMSGPLRCRPVIVVQNGILVFVVQRLRHRRADARARPRESYGSPNTNSRSRRDRDVLLAVHCKRHRIADRRRAECPIAAFRSRHRARRSCLLPCRQRQGRPPSTTASGRAKAAGTPISSFPSSPPAHGRRWTRRRRPATAATAGKRRAGLVLGLALVVDRAHLAAV